MAMFGERFLQFKRLEPVVKYFSDRTVIHGISDAFRDEDMSPADTSIEPGPMRALSVPGKVAYFPDNGPDETRDAQEQFSYYQSIGIGPKEIRFVRMSEGGTLL